MIGHGHAMSMGARMRQVPLMMQAIGLLQKRGGSVWLFDQTGTAGVPDGTVALQDGGDIAFVRDACAVYGQEIVQASWLASAFSSINQGLSITKATDAVSDTMTITASGTASSTYSDPVFNLLPAYVPTSGGETYELAASGTITQPFPGGSAPKLQLVEMDAGGSYIRGTLVGFGDKATVTLGQDCKQIRVAVFFGSWTAGTSVGLAAVIRRPTLRRVTCRQLTQPAVASRPKLKRVPKRLGPELVDDQSFAGGTWYLYQSTAAFSAGIATITDNSASDNPQLTKSLPMLVAGKSYQLTVSALSKVAGNAAQVAVRRRDTWASLHQPLQAPGMSVFTVPAGVSAAGSPFDVTCSASGDGSSAQFGGVSVREVLEWGWAAVFDGVDDKLATAQLPVADSESLVIAAQTPNATPLTQGLISKRNGNYGLMIRREGSLDTRGYAMTGASVDSGPLESAAGSMEKRVYSVVAATGDKRYRRNGIQTGSGASAYVSNAGVLTVGSELFSAAAGAIIFAAAYVPSGMPDAELAIVEKAFGQLMAMSL